MPVTVVVGGQYGSEGKGKVAEAVARRSGAAAVVRVGGTNSGHIAVDPDGGTWTFRQLPASSIVPGVSIILPAGALVDPGIFAREVASLGLGPDRVHVSPYATVIRERDRQAEVDMGLVASIGSTASGTGAALMNRIGCGPDQALAKDDPTLAPYLADTGRIMSAFLRDGRRVVVEGTQGFGLSLFHGGLYPYATSRDTTAGTFLGEAGLSPRAVDDVTLVIRAYPIRVAGASGELRGETTWDEVGARAGLGPGYRELTTATRKVRRVAHFDPDVVRRAIQANRPDRIVMNHFDYFDEHVRHGRHTDEAVAFVEGIEAGIGARVDWLGTGPSTFVDRDALPARTGKTEGSKG